MTETEKLRAFIMSYPGWEAGNRVYIDDTDGIGGNGGLFSEGLQELQVRTDILGNKEIDCRLCFSLYRTAQEPRADALWVMDFQSWVQRQCAQGYTPSFGDVPEKEHLRAEKGGLSRRTKSEMVYCVTLTAEFTKRYKATICA